MATVNTSETLKNKCLPQKSNNISTKGEENHLGNGEMLDNDLCLDLTTTSNSITTEGPKWHTPDKGPENNYFNCSKTSNKNDYCKNIRSHISEEKTIEQAEGPYVTEFRSPYMNHQMIHSWETFSKYDLGPYQWSSKSRMTDHMKSHSNINQFPYGDAKLIEKETEGVADPSLNRPKKRRQKYSAKERKCSYCFATFTNSDLYWAHYKTHLINKKIFACRHCAFVTEYKHHFTYHIQQHKGIKPFKCNQCSYEGISKSMLISHLRLHSVVHQYRCDDCDFGGKYIRQLLSHLKKTGHKPGQFLKPDGTPDDRKCLKVYREDNKLKLCIRFKGEESESGFKSDEGTKDVGIWRPFTSQIIQKLLKKVTTNPI
ncbi:protein hunchback isoform X2 [Aethina tumida]|uniref:protein hunchback isoform X2 n=1 Tax=Aethina tumida TaxID=116153 RepID=UPI00096B161E|nr:protein hunchback isoform X2 [Aethina tumida]